MDRIIWSKWRRARGVAKSRLLAELVTTNEPLVQRCADRYIEGSRFDLGGLREDILQAMRIGLLIAIDRWVPERGRFSTIAYIHMRHEAKQVRRHATPVSLGWRAFPPRSKQDAAAKFAAVHGREPTREELGTEEIADVYQRESFDAPAPVFTSLAQVDREMCAPELDPEQAVDTKRKLTALKAFVSKLPPKAKRDFWAGKRPDLTAAAKQHVESKCGR